MNSGKSFRRRAPATESGLPPPIAEVPETGSEPSETAESAAGYSFAKFLSTPQVDESKLGMTARVSRIVGKAGPDPVVGAPVSEAERDQWREEKIQLEDQIFKFKKELKKFRGEHGDYSDLDYQDIMTDLVQFPERPAVEGSEETELELLRRENFELRNMSKEERQSKAREIINKLRLEIDELKEENTRLRNQVDGLLRARESLADQRPPPDIMSTLRRLPMEISEYDKERVFQALENEWRNDYLESRHGGGEPIKNPFQKRRP